MPDAVLVVVDTSNKVVGTLRPRDLFRAVDIHGTSSLRDLTAGDVAGPAMIFHAQESAHAASILMAHERQDVAAVIDSRGSVCGVWTACDALATEGSARVEAARTALSASVNGRARDITEAVPSIGQEMPLRLLIGRLEAAPLGWLLVVDAAMRPVGVVTPAHLIGEVAGLGRGSLERLTVADVMASGVVCAGADASLEEVAELFAEKDCAFIAVCDGGGLMGIVRPERLLYIARTEGRRR